MVFLLLVSALFSSLTILILVGGISGQGGIKKASASTPEPAKGLILVYTEQLKPMVKAQLSGI